MFQRIGFIGTGAMGGAVAKIAAASAPGAALYLANHTAAWRRSSPAPAPRPTRRWPLSAT